MTSLLIKGGRILDPGAGIEQTGDLLVVDGQVKEIGDGLVAENTETIDAKGLLVVPGLIDIHVHLREPGREDKETIATGTRAAAAGGFTTVMPMPNTDPAIDSSTGVNHVLAVARRDGVVKVHPVAAVTKGREGHEITEFGDLAKAGAMAFSDDGAPIWNPEVMRCALEYTAMLNRVVMNHAELPQLVGSGVMHRGAVSTRLGLHGIPASAETACVARDIEIAAETGGHLHIQHVSTARTCDLVKDAKDRGVRVTAEACPHHLTITEDAVAQFNTLARVAPPLRTAADRDAIRQALREGIIDCIGTDHAPHTDIEKDQPFDQAPPGMIGLDFAFAQCFTALVKSGFMPLELLIQRMTSDPARVVGLTAGSLKIGSSADITIIDLNGETHVSRETIHSKSCNTPFLGQTFAGAIRHTIVDGQLVFSGGRILRDLEED